MNYFSIVLEQIGIFIIYAAVGIICIKCHVLDRSGLNVLSRFITKAALPLLIFTNTINGTTRESFLSSLSILAIAAVMYIVLFFLSMALAKILRLKGNMSRVYRAGTMFGNCGFMGIPITTALFPAHGGMYIAIYTVIDQFMLWTLGVSIITPSDNSKKPSFAQNLKRMVNPATVAILLGVICIFTGITLPSPVNAALTKTGAAATPLAMVYLGGMFCYINIADFLKKFELYCLVVVKMVILPLILYMILSHIPAVSSEIAVTMSVICALPTMSSVAMIAESQHSDSDYGAGMIFMTTLMSVVTLPIVCMLFR